ncbi:MAG: DUF4251 domain-containing protein [Pedobacter sp.]|nr:DUF4251 domain-containing protein [Pedobacter sp.]MDQ8053062.1 DUF4251 domain-containing protein [Pedobacter sp.]
MNFVKRIGLLALTLVALNASAQTKKEVTTKIVEEKNFIFVATTAMPTNTVELSNVMSRMNGGSDAGTISLSGSGYDLKISADSIVSFLPYYGRAYSAAYNNDDSGIKFTSKSFTYTSTKRKKGSWDIEISTKDVKDNVKMNLTVSESGYATLNVSSYNKQSITYNGYLKEVPKKSS